MARDEGDSRVRLRKLQTGARGLSNLSNDITHQTLSPVSNHAWQVYCANNHKYLHFHSTTAPTLDSLTLILLPNPPLHRRPLRNPINPLQQMRKLVHLLLGKPSKLPSLNPRPGADVGDAVFAFSFASEVFARSVGVFARKPDFEHAEDAEGFVLEALDGV